MANLEQVYKFSKILKIECIKKEVESFLKGTTLKDIKLSNATWECSFENENNDYLSLDASMVRNTLTLSRHTDDLVERINVDENLFMRHEIIEKRPNGIIYSIINKKFDISNRFKNEYVLVDLEEQRMVFTRNTLKRLIENIDFDKARASAYLLKFKMLNSKKELNKECDYCTEFSTHMNYYVPWESGRKLKDNIYPTRTYLNGEELSSLFDVKDGKEKLYQVYDLYNGIINPRNEDDIYAINLGFLNPDVYDLKTLKGITDSENNLVGKSLKVENPEYLNYLREMLNRRIGFKDSLSLDRNSILSGITYKMSGVELAKRQIEKKLGISYEEYEKLDIDEQHKLIEEKTGKKVKPDYRLYIDGIPMDEEHIITREQIDRKIDKLTENAPKRLLKKIFSKRK